MQTTHSTSHKYSSPLNFSTYAVLGPGTEIFWAVLYEFITNSIILITSKLVLCFEKKCHDTAPVLMKRGS